MEALASRAVWGLQLKSANAGFGNSRYYGRTTPGLCSVGFLNSPCMLDIDDTLMK